MSRYKENLLKQKSFISYIRDYRRYSEHTIRGYNSDLNQLIEYLGEDKRIIDLNKYDLHEYVILISKNISAKSLSRKIATPKSLFKFLSDENLIKFNVSKSLKIPKTGKNLPNYLTIDELKMFFEKTLNEIDISARDLVVIDILYSTGIRVSECASIQLEYIDLNKRTIKVVGKGSKERIVVFGDKTKINIINYLNDQSDKGKKFLFPSKINKKRSKNNCITTRTIYNIVKKYIKLISGNEKLGPHSLRHSFATHLLQRGSDLMAIKDLLGHESLGSTQIYTHLNTKRMREIYNKSHPHAKK